MRAMPNLTLTPQGQYSLRGMGGFSTIPCRSCSGGGDSTVHHRVIEALYPVGRQTRVEDNQKSDDRRHLAARRSEETSPQEQEPGRAPSLFSKSPSIAIPSLSSLKKPSSIPKPGAGSPFERPPQFSPTPATSPLIDALEEDDEQEEEDLRTQTLSPEDLDNLEFDSYIEETGQEPLHTERHAFQKHGAPIPAFATPGRADKAPPLRPEPPAPTFTPPAPTPAPPAQQGESKRTLLGMQAPTFSSPPRDFGQQPVPGAPAPGTGAQALQGRALSFGAEHAYASSPMPQPPHIEDAILAGAGDELTEVEEQAEYDAGEATSVFTPPEAYEPESATMISDVPGGDPGELDFSLDGEELDEDFAAQKTEVIQSPFEQEAILPKLKIIEGPMIDHEFILTELRSTIGRGNNTSIMVEDLAMSRLHFEIIRNADDSYLIRDLGSANGIGLNHTRIKEAILYDGDRVEAGKTVLIFAHPSSPLRANRHMIAVAGATLEGAAAPPLPEELQPVGPDEQTRMAALQIDQSTRLFTRIALGAGALCIPLCFLLVFAINARGSTSKPTSEPERDLPATTATAVEPSSQAIALYLAGAELIKSRQWDEARAKFEEARQADPSMDIAPQLERIQNELDARAKLDRAKNELEDPEEIKALAATIPPQSAYYDEAQTLVQLNRQDEVTTIYQEAVTLLGEDKLDEATAKLDVLARISPEHNGIPELREKLDERRAALEEEQRKQEEQDRVDDKANDIFKTSSSSSSSSSSSDSKADLSDGYSHYKRKNFRSAISSFKKAGGSKGKRLAKYAQTVDDQWSAGEKALNAKKYSSAASALEKALGADRNINKAHRKSIQSSLASAYGHAGLSELNAKDYRGARKYLAKGEKLKVSDRTLSELERGLENEAKKVYIQAVNKKKSNPEAAFDLCRKIMLMLPSSSPTYQKAQKLILTL